ncbi:MAG: hypothetical protein IJW49_07835 [Clostridia bacterium]|nr:hypothetical protein [Clostridia bacterium]
MKQKNLYKPLFAACLLLAVIAAILSAVAVITDYDTHENYFSKNAPLYLAACITAVVSLAVGIAAVCVTPRNELRDSPFCERNISSPAALGFLITLFAISIQENLEQSSLFLIPFITAALILATAYSVLSSLPKLVKERPNLVAGIGLTTVLACLFLNIYLYFDLTIEMNAPLKLFIQIGLLSAMIYYTTELRYLLKIPMPRVFLLVSVAAVSLGSLCIFALPVAFLTDKLPRFDYLACALLVLTILISIVVRAVTLIAPKKVDMQPTCEAESSPSEPQSDSNNEL